MKKVVILMIFATTLLFSCKKDNEDIGFDNAICKQEHFYYTFEEKYYIDSSLRNDYLLIGFKTTNTDEEINEFLNTQAYFKNENISERVDSNYKLIIRKFETSKACFEIDEIIDELQTYNIVSFATHTYDGVACIGFNCTELMSYGNELLVKLNDDSDIDELYELVNNTNTWIEEEKNSYTVIGVDKNSQGNALQMANYFYETGIFHYTQPNFHYFDIE
ncbi:hypothetical protein [Maribellus sediminis]|uniref:hypothetical protein n=1 Tax=Maribellus sediminis TaxID=2696285 RepID=UPI00142F620F|nr:hypothetical protein [Maribellus sediminis]